MTTTNNDNNHIFVKIILFHLKQQNNKLFYIIIIINNVINIQCITHVQPKSDETTCALKKNRPRDQIVAREREETDHHPCKTLKAQ